MSSVAIIRHWENVAGSFRRFQYIHFVINSSLMISMAFIIGIMTYGNGGR